MVRERWWPLAGNKSGINKPRRRGKRVREVFLGPEIVLSGELKSCGTLVAEGIVDGSRIECRKFILGSTGSCKGEVQAESAVISGRFEGRLIVRSRLLIKSGAGQRQRSKSRLRKSAQDDKWSFCLTAGTLCPANQENP